jgi:hypothetical protein
MVIDISLASLFHNLVVLLKFTVHDSHANDRGQAAKVEESQTSLRRQLLGAILQPKRTRKKGQWTRSCTLQSGLLAKWAGGWH